MTSVMSQLPRVGENEEHHHEKDVNFDFNAPPEPPSEPASSPNSTSSSLPSYNYSRGTAPRRQATNETSEDEQPARRRSNTSSAASDESEQRRMKRYCPKAHWFRPSPAVIDFGAQLMASKIYKIFTAFYTIVLLFGAQFQELWIPKEGDIVCDILYCCTLAFFVSDIIMRLYIESNYFVFQRCGRKGAWGQCHLGSFLFWCDLLSTSTLLYDISFINQELREMEFIPLEVNSFGLPVDGLDNVNDARPFEPSTGLFILIFRSARVARFIRASTVVKTSSKVNIYWICQRLNPFWYIDAYKQSRTQKYANTSTTSLHSEDGTNERGGLRDSGNSKQLMRRSSWGGLQVGIIAATKTKKKVENKGLKGAAVKCLRLLGIMRTDNEELRRQIAAIKIQRCWRERVKDDHEEYDAEDVAWSSQRQIRTSQVDRVLHKRSMLRTYQNVNKKFGGRTEKEVISGTEKKSKRTATSVGRRPESQVGSAMRELTGQRVAVGIIVALVLTVLFTYTENDATRSSTMTVLHNQTASEQFANASLEAARFSSIPDLFRYELASGEEREFNPLTGENPNDLRDREILYITVQDPSSNTTAGYFAYREERKNEALVEIFSIIFVLLVWYFGVTAFAGPIMMLVVIPIERMVRLLGMLMVDPLGYQSTKRYKQFVAEEDELTKNSRWTKEVLKGMETSFLMSTILRIGSLMKVGFGSAGVEIIRNSLEPGKSKNMLILNSQGSTVSCIFLFCDIRQFTDATECLQEEVFVFTNRIAAVVHSICHSYGGSANKNVGDAFLLSWLLEDDNPTGTRFTQRSPMTGSITSPDTFTAKHNQADKALLSVVRISIALHHDNFYIDMLSETARDALLTKLAKRKGPVVQMGCGLHAGKAVQGAIGSQRKIDATYVSEAVERAEFLESSTKKYGLKMLMSDSFHRLLHPSNRRRCRKVDQILLKNDEDEENDETMFDGDAMELFTFDMDIDALWKAPPPNPHVEVDAASDTESVTTSNRSQRESLKLQASIRHVPGGGLLTGPLRRRSVMRIPGAKPPSAGTTDGSEEFRASNNTLVDVHPAPAGSANPSTEFSEDGGNSGHRTPELVLPTGPALYNANVWLSDDMRKIRQLYSDGLFFQKFNSGFLAYYARDWEHAKQCFEGILERFDDGPSRYFLKCIEEHNGVPPRNFLGYGTP